MSDFIRVYYYYQYEADPNATPTVVYTNDPDYGTLVETIESPQSSPAGGHPVQTVGNPFKFPINADYLFAGCTNGFDSNTFNPQKGSFGQCSSAKYLFYGCHGLTDATLLNGTSFENVRSIRGMFGDCSNLQFSTISLDCTEVEDMAFMFYFCDSLQNVTLGSDFRTSNSNLKTMTGMFGNCTNLKSLALHFNTGSVTDMEELLGGCSSLASYSDTFDTSKCETLTACFTSCSKLKELDLRHGDLSSAKKMDDMFCDCGSLEAIYLPGTIPPLEDCSDCFSWCPNLKYIIAPKYTNGDLGAMVDSSNMFSRSTKLRNFDPTQLGLSKANNYEEGYFTYGELMKLHRVYEKNEGIGIGMDVLQKDSEGGALMEVYR